MKFRFLIALVAVVWASYVQAADWPRYHGPDNNGISKETGLLKEWPEGGPKVLWTQTLGQGYSSVAVAKGRVYTMFQNAEGQHVVAFDEKTGNQLWKFRTGPIWNDPNGKHGTRATPTVDGDRVYALDTNGEFVCLSADKGEKIYQQNILTMANAPNIKWGMAQSPFIVDDIVYFNPGGKGAAFMALEKKSGDVVWKSGDAIAGYSTPVRATIGGIDQLVFAAGKEIVGVQRSDGKILWSYPWETSYNVNAASPIVVGDMVFVSSGYKHGAILIKVDPAKRSADKVWENKTIQAHFGTPVLIDGYLYGYKEQDLTCVDFKTGQDKWVDEEAPGKGQITIADGLAYILGEEGEMILAELSPSGCKKISSMRISPSADRWAPLTIANGRLYMRDDKQIYCLDIKGK